MKTQQVDKLFQEWQDENHICTCQGLSEPFPPTADRCKYCTFTAGIIKSTKMGKGARYLDVASFKEAIKEGVRALAIYKDGKQFVGVQQVLLNEVLKRIDDEEGYWGDIIRAKKYEGV